MLKAREDFKKSLEIQKNNKTELLKKKKKKKREGGGDKFFSFQRFFILY
jgi:hypothetical protein